MRQQNIYFEIGNPDLTLLCKDAAMGPLRELGTRVTDIPLESIRPVNMKDFTNSLTEKVAIRSRIGRVQFTGFT